MRVEALHFVEQPFYVFMLHLGDAAAAHKRALTREPPAMTDAARAPAGPRALAHCVGSSRMRSAPHRRMRRLCPLLARRFATGLLHHLFQAQHPVIQGGFRERRVAQLSQVPERQVGMSLAQGAEGLECLGQVAPQP